jgi:hypothetical protein
MKNPLLVLITVITSGLIGLLAVIFGSPLEARTSSVQCSREVLSEEFRDRLENEFRPGKSRKGQTSAHARKSGGNLRSRSGARESRWANSKPQPKSPMPFF